jgi:nucleotide-binding universal stress UspA family protein
MEIDEELPTTTAGANADELSVGSFGRRIVVPTDFSEGSHRALTVAIQFGKLLRAAIDLLHVQVIPSYLPVPAVPGATPLPPPTPEAAQGIQESLSALAAAVRARGIECQTKTVEGNPCDEIVDHAAKIGADLIVMGSHGRTGLGRVLLGSVAEKVLHRATCPVLVVPIRDAGLDSPRD